MTTQSRTVGISIARPSGEVYTYLADPTHIPQWSAFITAVQRDGDDWLGTTPGGPVRIRFCPPNAFGVLDHWVSPLPGTTVYVPFRVVPHGSEAAEVLFTVFRLPEMTDDQFERDIGMVRADLAALKRTLEASPGGAS